MPILALEGPNASGKTTVAATLAASDNAFVVAEVNVLFRRPPDEPPDWYLERQSERWDMSARAAQSNGLVILDGDPFQPLWYNWAYDFEGWQPLDELVPFYRPRIARGEMGFPDRYIIFTASEGVLRDRKAADVARRRRGFETHLRFIEPQRRYFEAMQRASPDRVVFVESRTVEDNAASIRRAAQGTHAERNAVSLFDHLVGWLRAQP